MPSLLKTGWAQADITPKGPCMLAGQMGNRLATEVLDPLDMVGLQKLVVKKRELERLHISLD